MKRWLSLPLLLLLVAPVRAAPVDGLAAVVDDRIITRSEFDQALALAERTGRASGPEARAEVLEGLIERALVQREAKRQGLGVADDEVQRAIADIRSRNGLDENAFRSALAGQGMDYEAYLAEVGAQILRLKVAGRALRAKLQVGDEALREFYLRNVAQFCEADSVRLIHIQAGGADARQAAEATRARVLAGETPEAATREAAPSASVADMGYVLVNNLSEEVRAALRDTPQGGVSPVVEMRGTCSLFVVADRKGGRVPAFEEVRERVRDRYYEDREEELYRSWIESLKERARIVRKM